MGKKKIRRNPRFETKFVLAVPQREKENVVAIIPPEDTNRIGDAAPCDWCGTQDTTRISCDPDADVNQNSGTICVCCLHGLVKFLKNQGA